MKIATWNVNSIRARLPRVLAWLERRKPDLVCVQETKVEDALFPRAELESAGYVATVLGERTYNGVAFLSRQPLEDVARGYPDDRPDAPKRLIAGTYGGVRVVNVYVPNGESVGSVKFAFKLEWLEHLRRYLDALCDRARPLLLCGDFNVAPEDRDVHDPERWRGQVLFHPDERARLQACMEWGLRDSLRLHTEAGGLFTWWDYRAGAFHRGWGLRIDHLLVSEPLARLCRSVEIDRDERKGLQPSDHAPVVGEFEIP
jgi:exodeoxyribonuclease III